MVTLKAFLFASTLGIYALTYTAIASSGFNWPAVAINDLMSLNWRSQFDFDFIVHLLLLATWVVWREGATPKAYVFGVLSVVMGGMFSFPYLFHAIAVARGEPRAILLGVHASKDAQNVMGAHRDGPKVELN